MTQDGFNSGVWKFLLTNSPGFGTLAASLAMCPFCFFSLPAARFTAAALLGGPAVCAGTAAVSLVASAVSHAAATLGILPAVAPVNFSPAVSGHLSQFIFTFLILHEDRV